MMFERERRLNKLDCFKKMQRTASPHHSKERHNKIFKRTQEKKPEEQKKFNEAISYLKLADAKFHKNAQVNYFLGTLFDRLNDKENMLFHMNKVIDADSEHVQALNYLAYSLAEMKKDLRRAEQLALKAEKLDQTDAFIKDTVGWVYYQKGDYVKKK